MQFHIEIDGGITLDNVQTVVEAGAEWMVAGSAVFHTVNPRDTFVEMTRLANQVGQRAGQR